jgi:dienelactone hydrolase
MTVTHSPGRPTTVARKRTLRRKLFIAGLITLSLVIIASGVLWILKPWVKDIPITAPGKTGERIEEPGLFANYFPAKAKRGPGVLLLGGSEGGIGIGVTRNAIELQSKGFSVLSPSYFGAPGQPASLELVALETFDRALDWLGKRPEVDPERMAVVGHSKGAEAALLIGVRHPELRAVLAAAPSSVVWDGIDWSNPINPDPSWTSHGEPLPSLGFGLWRPWNRLGRVYEDGLKKLNQHPDAEIPVERIKAEVLLVCGEADTLWPSCPMARRLESRDAGIEVLAYKRAGHSAFGPQLPVGHPHLTDRWSGGSAQANNEARAKSWPKIIDFLRAQLG